MDKIAIVFPGQASQYVGMGRDLYEADAAVRNLYDIASQAIGENIARLSFEGPAEKLKQTRFTQPAILLHSLAVLTVMKDSLPKAVLTAGHSLGEYGALALAGILSPEEALIAVVKRASLMEDACRREPGTMAAIMGLDEAKIENICRTALAVGVVVPANFNSGNQIVISGSVDGVNEACRLCKEAGARRVMVLEVGGAFHSPLMSSAREGMAAYLSALDFAKPLMLMVPNVTAHPEKDAARIKQLLVEQLTAPVKWYHTMKTFANEGIDTFIEIGPGKVLTGLARRELPEATMINVDKREDIENFTATYIN